MSNNNFIVSFSNLQVDVHNLAKSKGWHDKDKDDGTWLCLMHSELSEGLEALRVGNPPDDKIPQYSGIEAELADVIIRIMDYAELRGLDVAGAIVAKHEMNATRQKMHGGKKF